MGKRKKKEKELQQVMRICLNEKASDPQDKEGEHVCLKNTPMVSYSAISACLTFKIKYLLQRTSSFLYATVHGMQLPYGAVDTTDPSQRRLSKGSEEPKGQAAGAATILEHFLFYHQQTQSHAILAKHRQHTHVMQFSKQKYGKIYTGQIGDLS